MKTTITVLCDNYIGKSGLVGEHGFSVLIERGGEQYLFDTGPGMSLPMNLKALDKTLDRLRLVLISHGHYDHTGGLKWVLQHKGQVEVVAHPALFSRHMVADLQKKEVPRYIGCPYTREELEQMGAVFKFVGHTTEVLPGLWFVTGIDADPAKRPNDARLVLSHQGSLYPDLMEDDSSILLETDGGPVLILGCAHAGVLNILDHLKNQMGVHKLQAVLGGTHLMFYDSAYLQRVIDRLQELETDMVGVSHCTGMNAAFELAKRLGDRFALASVGSCFQF